MKKLIYLLLFCPLVSLSQSYIIEYDVSLNVLKRSGYLIVNNTEESFYYEVKFLDRNMYKRDIPIYYEESEIRLATNDEVMIEML